MRSKVAIVSFTGVVGVVLSIAGAGAAYAVSGGGYSSPQQDCPWDASEWNTPQYQTYPGCHNAQLTLESGGMTNGMPNNRYNNSPRHGEHGAANTTWLQFGIDQSPNDENSKGTGTLYSLGYPGQSSATHSGCLSVNTDGTNGGPTPEGKKPVPVSKAANQQKYGCGNNKKGAGFALNWDYYQFYCPIAAAIPGFPYACQSIPGGDIGENKLTPDTGTKQNLTKILSEGFILYYGMDDNSDNGEHDGEGPLSSPQTQGSEVGPSDGGAVMIAFTPYRLAESGTLSQPEGLINASTGFCADGICAGATSEKQMIYQGCNANTGNDAKKVRCKKGRENSQRDSYDYSGKKWDPETCNSGGEQDQPRHKPQPDAPANCNSNQAHSSPGGPKRTKGGMDYWRRQEAHTVSNEPGFQFFEDPDAMGSPALPLYPLPAIYAGTCGVVLGGGGAAMPASPLTNKAHQLQIKTGC
ncbi:MAG TPA: hypothetical protein VHD81_12130 [Mycobacteriales bacterium]|nr:hypothetical protein [Mycobacteriales bacterium]